MKNFVLKHKYGFCLFVLLLISFLYSMYYGSHKEYMYQDEVLSYICANNPDGPTAGLEDGQWYQGSDVVKPLTASEGHTFDYALVWKNQELDTHPPLYHVLLHTICSFFPGQFSKWFALAINIAALMILEIILYRLSLLLYRDNHILALITVAAFAGSVAVMTQTMFLRMYMVQQIFTLLLLFLHVKNLIRPLSYKKFYLFLFLVTVSGTLTQYYYLIFAFFIAAFYCVYLLFKKEWKAIGGYVLTMLLSGGTVLLIFPGMLHHLFGGEVGSATMENILNLNRVKERVVTIYAMLNRQLFGSCAKIFLFVVLLYCIFRVVEIRKKGEKPVIDNFVLAWRLLAFSAAMFGIVVTMITPYLCDRYFAPVFAPIILLTVAALYKILTRMLRYRVVALALILIFMLYPAYGEWKNGITDTSKLEMLKTAEENADTICIADPSVSMENFMELSRYSRIYVTRLESDEIKLDGDAKDAKQLVVYVPGGMDVEELAGRIYQANPKLSGYERSYVSYYGTTYYFHE